jgi:histidine triad (HIT) family protein
MRDDIFSRILSGELPCNHVYQNDVCIAIENKFPKAQIHCLVMPKIFCQDFVDFSQKTTADYLAKFFESVNHVATNVLNLKDGFKIIMNTGVDSGQTVMYFHVHIISGKFFDQEI